MTGVAGLCGVVATVSGDAFEGVAVLVAVGVEVLGAVPAAVVVADVAVVVDDVAVLGVVVAVPGAVVVVETGAVVVVEAGAVVGAGDAEVTGAGPVVVEVTGPGERVPPVSVCCGALTLGVLVDGPAPVRETLLLSGPPLPPFGANAVGALEPVLPPGVVVTDVGPADVDEVTPGPLPAPFWAGASAGGAYEERLTSLDPGVCPPVDVPEPVETGEAVCAADEPFDDVPPSCEPPFAAAEPPEMLLPVSAKTAGDEAPGDEAPGDEAPDDEAPEDDAPEGEAPDDEAPEDEAPEDEDAPSE